MVFGATNVPLFCGKVSQRRSALFSLLFFSVLGVTHAAEEDAPIHYSGDKQVWDRKANRVELIGHAVVRQPGETLTADYVILDQNARTLDAHGSCVYIGSDAIIYGEEMHFNLDTRTGTIISGRVSNEQFTLSGERINKLGQGRFQTHWGEYSTCVDCPASWSLQARDVDMEVEGYAYLNYVTAKIKDVPSVWLPYLILPMKTRRQSGLLFPRFEISNLYGIVFVPRYFWAINRSSDMTIGLGEYSSKGHRIEWEGRYALSTRSGGQANFYHLNDKDWLSDNFNGYSGQTRTSNRWSLTVAQTQELPLGVDQKLRWIEVGDNHFPFQYGADVAPFMVDRDLTSSLSFSRASSEVSSYIAIRRYRNLFNTNQNAKQFDPTTVQALPTAVVTTNDQLLLGGPLALGLTLGVSNFTRSHGPFDYDDSKVPFNEDPKPDTPGFTPGVDPLRKATRVSVTPTLYTTFRPLDRFTLVPSLTYYSYFYSFHNVVDNLHRGYALFQTDLSTQFEKIYDNTNKSVPRTKHLIRPILTYSYIPARFVREDRNHPFLAQIRNAQAKGYSGYNFDDYDIVPIDSSPSSAQYFTPLGNSLAYGFTTQLIDRVGTLEDAAPGYETTLKLRTGQAIDFRQFQTRGDAAQPFTQFFGELSVDPNRKFHFGSNYTYTPYISGIRHELDANASYQLISTVRERVLSFERSVAVGYVWHRRGFSGNVGGSTEINGGVTYSITDYILPTVSTAYDLLNRQFSRATITTTFQSPSRCWKLALVFNFDTSTSWSFKPDLSLNITGAGFGGVTEIANTQTAQKTGQ